MISISTPNKKTLRDFALLTGTIVALLFGAILPWLFGRPYPIWPWLTGITLTAWALLAPSSLAPVYRAWMRIGHILGWINGRIILSVLFYTLVFPVGSLIRLFGKDPMQRRFDQSRLSYRLPSIAKPVNHLEKPF